MDREKNGHNEDWGMKCAKYLVILLSAFHLLIALAMMTFGLFSYVANDSFLVWYDYETLNMFSIFLGVILTAIAIFGMIGTFKERDKWINLYGVFLTITLVLQVLIFIAAFLLIRNGSSRYPGISMVNRLMMTYKENESSANIMDWIQNTYKCCGSEGPSDWGIIEVMPGNTVIHDGFDFHTYSYLTSTVPGIINDTQYKTPKSCCTENSFYQNMKCDEYYEKGCTLYKYDIITGIILIIGSVLLTIGAVHILSIVSAFTLATLMRRTKQFKYVKIWDIQRENVYEAPTFVK